MAAQSEEKFVVVKTHYLPPVDREQAYKDALRLRRQGFGSHIIPASSNIVGAEPQQNLREWYEGK